MALSSVLRQAAAAQAGEIGRQVRAAMLTLVLMLIAGVLLLVGLIFLMLGAYESLAAELPNWQAGGAVALGTLFVCLLLLIIAGRQGKKPRRRPVAPPPPPPGAPLAPDERDPVRLGAAAGEMLSRNRPSGVELGLAALVAGLVASRMSKRRPD